MENKEVVEEVIETIADKGFVMRNLKTKDLPKMMKILKKTNAKSFLNHTMNIMFTEEVDPLVQKEVERIKESYMAEMEGKTVEDKELLMQEMEKEQLKILYDERTKQMMGIFEVVIETLIENYDKAYDDINEFVGSLYNINKKEVENLDLGIFIELLYNLRKQDELINFFKLALK